MRSHHLMAVATLVFSFSNPIADSYIAAAQPLSSERPPNVMMIVIDD